MMRPFLWIVSLAFGLLLSSSALFAVDGTFRGKIADPPANESAVKGWISSKVETRCCGAWKWPMQRSSTAKKYRPQTSGTTAIVTALSKGRKSGLPPTRTHPASGGGDGGGY